MKYSHTLNKKLEHKIFFIYHYAMFVVYAKWHTMFQNSSNPACLVGCRFLISHAFKASHCPTWFLVQYNHQWKSILFNNYLQEGLWMNCCWHPLVEKGLGWFESLVVKSQKKFLETPHHQMLFLWQICGLWEKLWK